MRTPSLPSPGGPKGWRVLAEVPWGTAVQGELKVKVTDFEGNPLNLDNVALTAGFGKNNVYTDKSFKPAGDPGVYVSNFFSTKQAFGVYE